MYYLLKLEVSEKLDKGSVVIDFGDTPFPYTKIGECDLNHSGLLWDGQEVFSHISSRYQNGDKLEHDIYDISFSWLSVGDDRGLGDHLWCEIEDLLQYDLIEQWSDLDKPIVFLMSISTYTCHTEIGDEYETENVSINVVTNDDLKKLEHNAPSAS